MKVEKVKNVSKSPWRISHDQNGVTFDDAQSLRLVRPNNRVYSFHASVNPRQSVQTCQFAILSRLTIR